MMIHASHILSCTHQLLYSILLQQHMTNYSREQSTFVQQIQLYINRQNNTLRSCILLCSWNLLVCTAAHFLTVSRMWPLAGPVYTWEFKIIWHLTCMCYFSTSKNPFQIAEHSDSQCSTVYHDTWKLAKCRIKPYRTFTYTVPYSMRIWQW